MKTVWSRSAFNYYFSRPAFSITLLTIAIVLVGILQACLSN